VREKKKKKKKKPGEKACVRGEGEEEEKKERKKSGEEACVRGEGEEEEACVRGEGEEEEEEKKKKPRAGREGEVGCFLLILIYVFFEVSACEWRVENPFFLHHPYNSCSLTFILYLIFKVSK
jgi:hypothetical protein